MTQMFLEFRRTSITLVGTAKAALMLALFMCALRHDWIGVGCVFCMGILLGFFIEEDEETP